MPLASGLGSQWKEQLVPGMEFSLRQILVGQGDWAREPAFVPARNFEPGMQRGQAHWKRCNLCGPVNAFLSDIKTLGHT